MRFCKTSVASTQDKKVEGGGFVQSKSQIMFVGLRSPLDLTAFEHIMWTFCNVGEYFII